MLLGVDVVGVAIPGVPNVDVAAAGVPGVPKRLVDGEPNKLVDGVAVDGVVVAVAVAAVGVPKRLVEGAAGVPNSDVVGAVVVAGAEALPATGNTVLGPHVTFDDCSWLNFPRRTMNPK